MFFSFFPATILCPWTFPVKVRICASPPEGGPCDLTLERWNYNKSTGICSKFVYGGCFGNANSFDTEERCLACSIAFQPDFELICAMPPKKGPCTHNLVERWYHNPKSGSCETFIYGGCGGNFNRYRTEAECRKEC
ncbi:unnamed protein product, partial [Ixodes persulcatus]